MRFVRLLQTLLILVAWCQSFPVWGQVEEGLQPTSASGTDLNYTPPATLLPEIVSPADSPAAQSLWQRLKLDYTWLPGIGNYSLQINDVEFTTTVAVPFAEGWAPLLIAPGLAAHFWEGPTSSPTPSTAALPSSLYDAYVELGWRPQLAPWLFTDLAVTPGVYSDFKEESSEKLQMRGRGLAIVAFSRQLQLVAGALYVNRNKTRVLPAGGVIWNPDEDTKLSFVFPQPKLAHRLATFGDTQWWAYLSGEFGGGRWSVEEANGSVAFVDYTDVRVLLGMEWLVHQGLNGHVEIGYVFDRKVNYTSDLPDFNPGSTLLLRAGFGF